MPLIETNKPKPEGFPLVFTVIIALALLVIAFNLLQLFAPGVFAGFAVPSLNPFQSSPASQTATVTLLSAPNCPECFDLATQIKGMFVVQLRNATAGETEQLAQRYNVSKLPALVISNESAFSPGVYAQVKNFVKQSGPALILEAAAPPFYDVTRQKVRGNVELIAIADASCTKCTKVSDLVSEFKQNGIYIAKEENLAPSTPRGQELLSKYGLGFAPAFIFSQDLLDYPQVAQGLQQVGKKESDGNFVLHTPFPPYVNLSSGAVEGLVNVTYLTDNSCVECYNVTMHRNVLQRYLVYVEGEKTLDVSTEEGRNFAARYNITLVPTVGYSSGISVYSQIARAWPQVGTVEADGSFVFRSLNTTPGITYKNLATNQTLNSTAPLQQAAPQ